MNFSIKRTIDVKDSEFRSKYHVRIKEISKGVLNEEKFYTIYNLIYSNYKDDIMPTMPTLAYHYEYNLDNNFCHLIQDRLITINDSTEYNYTFKEYIAEKQKTVNETLG